MTARAATGSASRSPDRVPTPLFSTLIPDDRGSLERTINVARIVGVSLLAIAIVSGQVTSPLAPILLGIMAAQSAYVVYAFSRRSGVSPRASVVSSCGDVLVGTTAMFELATEDPWTAPATCFLVIIVVALRLGRGGAIFAAVASSIGLVAAAAYRGSTAGLPTTIETATSWITFYLIAALVMSGAVRELGLLRLRQGRQHERDVALLDAQSDLGEMLLVVAGNAVLETNEAVAQLTGRSAGAESPLDLHDLFAPEDVERIRAHVGEPRAERFEVKMPGPDGSPFDAEVAVKRVRRDAGRLIIIARDVSGRKRAERTVEYQSLYDPLTGLPNRALLMDRVRLALAAAERGNDTVTVLLLDVARFRQINDSLGFRAGDALLTTLAERLTTCLRSSDTVARVGGDEFAVVIAGSQGAGDRAISAVKEAVERPAVVEGSTILLEVTMGIAHHPQDGADPATLLQHAEVAMYDAKLSGAQSATYAPDRMAPAPSQLVAAELQRAIAQRALVLFYQPQVPLRRGGPLGVEALVRWQHPRFGLLQPKDFVPLAEGTALCRPFSDHVMTTALHDRSTWTAPFRDLQLSVNLSRRDLLDPGLPEAVRAFLAGAERRRPFVVEVTERVLLSDTTLVHDTLTALADIGVLFSIDDFGTAASSLEHLMRLPVAEVKIDRSFVVGARDDPKRRAIVRATIDLAHALGARAVAEGVEDERTLELLTELGCDAAQGYHIARPMPAGEVAGWFAASRWSAGTAAGS